MDVSTDRRSVLIGLSALGLTACSGRMEAGAEAAPARAGPEVFDLSALEAHDGGRLGFVAHDLGSGRLLTWRAEERFVYCSTFKLFLAAATFLRVQAGEERLDRMIPIAHDELLDWTPITRPAAGGALSVEALMRGAVEMSDGTAANLLLRAMGGPAGMQGFYRGLGDVSTRSDRYEPELVRWDGDKDTIQPLQSAVNIHALLIAPETPLAPEFRTRLIGWMAASPTGPGRMKAGAPDGWKVAHKTGTGGYGPTNDIGVLYPPAGAPVIIAAYHHGARETAHARNEAVIAEATRMALGALGHV